MARTVILGNGGHARALRQVISYRGGLSIFSDDIVFLTSDMEGSILDSDILHVGVGDISSRKALFGKFQNQIPNCGIQVMERVYLGPNRWLGNNVLINTGAQIDHDCKIEDHCVISPGAILCGGVKLGEACFIGAGAIIVENVELAPETFVPAGTLVCGPDDFRRPQRVV